MYPKYALAALIVLMPLGAADFWHEKKFTEWSEKQARRLLEGSPWARAVAIPADGGRSRRRVGDDLSDATQPGRRSRSNVPSAPEAPPATTAILRWHTALPLKQAIARLRFGDAAASAPDAVQMLSRQEDRYVLAVTNLPPAVLRASADELLPRMRLRIKGKPDIVAERIQADRQERSVDIYLIFPKGRDGSAVIELSDGEVEVALDFGDLKISRKFKLKEMVFGGKLEI